MDAPAMKGIDALSDDEIKDVISKAQIVIAKREQERKRKATEQIKKIAASVGLKVEIREKLKQAPKYRNPDNEKQTWTGIGVKPKWFKACLERGLSEKDLLIK